MKPWQPGKRNLNVEVIIVPEFRNKDHFKHIFVELILISEITNSEIGITSTLRYFCQADRISFRKNSVVLFYIDL